MPYRSPSQRATTPQGRGRFPGYDVLDQVPAWDDVTTGAVLARLALPGALAFFTPEEAGIGEALVDLLLNQDGEPRIPVLALIDARLCVDETDGWHYDDMPQDSVAWRESLHLLDQDAIARHGRGFALVATDDRAALVQAVQDLATNEKTWHAWAAKHLWSLWTRYTSAAFYSHPWAWNEIGFGGPAYPRGYLNPGVNAREKWEVPDHVDTDPVPFSERVNRARDAHADLVGDTGGGKQ